MVANENSSESNEEEVLSFKNIIKSNADFFLYCNNSCEESHEKALGFGDSANEKHNSVRKFLTLHASMESQFAELFETLLSRIRAKLPITITTPDICVKMNKFRLKMKKLYIQEVYRLIKDNINSVVIAMHYLLNYFTMCLDCRAFEFENRILFAVNKQSRLNGEIIKKNYEKETINGDLLFTSLIEEMTSAMDRRMNRRAVTEFNIDDYWNDLFRSVSFTISNEIDIQCLELLKSTNPHMNLADLVTCSSNIKVKDLNDQIMGVLLTLIGQEREKDDAASLVKMHSATICQSLTEGTSAVFAFCKRFAVDLEQCSQLLHRYHQNLLHRILLAEGQIYCAFN